MCLWEYFPEEIGIWISSLSKGAMPSPMWMGIIHIGQNGKERVISLLVFSRAGHPSSTAIDTGTPGS